MQLFVRLFFYVIVSLLIFIPANLKKNFLIKVSSSHSAKNCKR